MLTLPDGRNTTLSRDQRRSLADDLLDELAGSSPRDWLGTFRTWHRGALSLIHLNVLAVLDVQGPVAMSRLAEALDVSDASATGIVGRMEERGLVEREHATDDRRVVLVRPTERGGRVFRDLEEHRRERLTRLVQELSDDELAGLLAGLRAMHAARKRLFHPEAPPSADGAPVGDVAHGAADASDNPAPVADPMTDNADRSSVG